MTNSLFTVAECRTILTMAVTDGSDSMSAKGTIIDKHGRESLPTSGDRVMPKRVVYFISRWVFCASCGAEMITTIKSLSDTPDPYLEAWCPDGECGQRDKVIKISPSETYAN